MGVPLTSPTNTPKPPRLKTSRRYRQVRHFTLSQAVSDRIDELAFARRISRSDLVEALVTFDYSRIFELFKAGTPHHDVVILTGHEPSFIRELYAEFRAGYEACEAVPEVAVARAHESAARERRIAAERIAEVRLAETISRDRRHRENAWVKIHETNTRKHLGELAENSKVLASTRRAKA